MSGTLTSVVRTCHNPSPAAAAIAAITGANARILNQVCLLSQAPCAHGPDWFDSDGNRASGLLDRAPCFADSVKSSRLIFSRHHCSNA
jgi:hypothetical protein